VDDSSGTTQLIIDKDGGVSATQGYAVGGTEIIASDGYVKGGVGGVGLRHFVADDRPALKDGESAWWYRGSDMHFGILTRNATEYAFWNSDPATGLMAVEVTY
jgi:hypothetical protein